MVQLAAICAMNALGYVIFRTSENQRLAFAQKGASSGLDSIPAIAGRRILCAGWWAIVRHPNYLGEVLMQWSWVLPAGKKTKEPQKATVSNKSYGRVKIQEVGSSFHEFNKHG